jgi:hypothetical protein
MIDVPIELLGDRLERLDLVRAGPIDRRTRS